MRWREYAELIADSLIHQKVRAILTTSGVIFGVAAVVAMTSISEGARREILDSIRELGTNTLIIQHTQPDNEAKQIEQRSKWPAGLSMNDVDQLSQVVPPETHLIPIRHLKAEVRFPVLKDAKLVGTLPNFPTAVPVHQTAGRFFHQEDGNRQVAVISSSLAHELYPMQNPLRHQLKIEDLWFTIIGIVDPPQGSFRAGGLDFSSMGRDIYIPLDALTQRTGLKANASELQTIVVKVQHESQVREVASLLHRNLLRRHLGVEDTRVIVPLDLLRQRQRAQRVFSIVMGAIASIALLTGGIGIMNIMLSSVLERTREIGVRRAIGATRKNVAFQFLAEAVFLCVLGGVVGVLFGVGLAYGITKVAGWRTVIGLQAVFSAMLISAAVGILFGWWPARKAGQMNVINAIRYE